MDKRELLNQFAALIAEDLAVFTQAAMAAHEAATHTESKPEDQYDTRSVEASYLAGAQSKRAMELEELLSLYKHVDLKAFGPDSPIASTAVVELESEGKHSTYLLMPKGGGLSVSFHGKTIQVVTPLSPMGQAILGRKVGDSLDVTVQRATKEYEIVEVW
jgi:transcription elongation GreA/GreB family factor